MKYTFIGFDHKKGTFAAEGKTINYDNYDMRFVRDASDIDNKNGKFGKIIVPIKFKASEIRHIASSQDDLARCIGYDFNIYSEPNGYDKVKYYIDFA